MFSLGRIKQKTSWDYVSGVGNLCTITCLIWATVYFVIKALLDTALHTCVLFKSVFVIEPHCWIATTKTIWLEKPKIFIFTIWLFTGKVCQPLLDIIASTLILSLHRANFNLCFKVLWLIEQAFSYSNWWILTKQHVLLYYTGQIITYLKLIHHLHFKKIYL